MHPAPPIPWQQPSLRHYLEQNAPEQLRRAVTCACGRECLPSEMLDVRGLPSALRVVRCREQPAPVPEFLCSPCLEVLYGLELIDRIEMAERHGAPPAWCAWYAAKIERHPTICGRPRKLSPLVAQAVAQQRLAFAAADFALQELRVEEAQVALAEALAETAPVELSVAPAEDPVPIDPAADVPVDPNAPVESPLP
jgi:hypothetical protein